VKNGATVNPDFYKGFQYLEKTEGLSLGKMTSVYGGDSPQLRHGVEVTSWWEIG